MKGGDMRNPFTLRAIAVDAPFCNRDQELRDLHRHAVNKTNVVVFSPRRYGKTSLVKRVQAKLQQEGFLTFYADFFMVTSVSDIAERLAKSVYSVLHQKQSLLKKGMRYLKTFKTFRPVFKPSAGNGFTLTVEPSSSAVSGVDLLDSVLEELGLFIRKESSKIHIVLDEFQEIMELKKSPVEGLLRKHTQEHPSSYFFVGSRRRVLLDIFNQRSRPFYQSAIMYPIKPLPHDQLTSFLVDQFVAAGKKCSVKIAELISERTFQYPYYAQVLAYNVFEVAGRVVEEKDIEAGLERLFASERYGYEATVQGLTAPQLALLRALATSPDSKILSGDYLRRHKLTVGGIQYAQKKLVQLDLIEKHNDMWRVVDPVFACWLSRY
jgi:hypothetical protein